MIVDFLDFGWKQNMVMVYFLNISLDTSECFKNIKVALQTEVEKKDAIAPSSKRVFFGNKLTQEKFHTMKTPMVFKAPLPCSPSSMGELL